jgi:cytochrome b pre-mRNA-processing protein 3
VKFNLNPFRLSPAQTDAERLYLAIVATSRRPELYGPERIPDTLDGRFEVVTAIATLALRRLQGKAAEKSVGQALANRLFAGFDAGLREAGVGDLSVPKKMQKIAGAFYGRVQAYGPALDAVDAAPLAEALTRNVWDGAQAPFANVLAERMRAFHARLAREPDERIPDETVWASF